ncbi:MAG: cysteine desulfurase family protein [Streptosporangiaceae bacterium]
MAYLDHAATTPMFPEAIAAMSRELGRLGNPSSLHAPGREARRVVEEAREAIADALVARPSEVIFTGSGTEADNLAIKGLYWARRTEDPERRRVLVGAAEHHAVLDAADWLGSHEDAQVELLPVDPLGRVQPDVLDEAIGRAPETVALVSVMWANNEVGTVQPIRELAAVAHAYDVPLHSDAVQTVAQLPVDFSAGGVDALALAGHKLGGPLGVGALVLSRGLEPVPVLHGGGQERDVRSGTLDTPSIAGLAAAVRIAVDRRPTEADRLTALRDDLIRRMRGVVPDAVLFGDPGPGAERRLPGNAHFSFPGCEGDSLLLLLDARGIACSTGSACTAGVPRPSHVVLAMGADIDRARGSLRFSLGHTSTQADVDALAEAIGPAVERARHAGLVGSRGGS